MDSLMQEYIMRYLRRNKIVDKVSHSMFIEMSEICYENIYGKNMNNDNAIRDAVGIVLLANNVEIPGYKIWVA